MLIELNKDTNLKGEIKNFEKINMEICFDSIEFWMEYNYYI